MNTRSRKDRPFKVILSWLPLPTKGLVRFRKTKLSRSTTIATKKDVEEIPNPYYDLPSELIAEILSWLPFKDLVRFMAVSKSWNSLLLCHHNSDLAILKFQHAPQKPQLNSQKLLLPRYNRFYLLDYESGFYDERALANLDCPKECIKNTGVIGSCNGLVCLYVPENLARNRFVKNVSSLVLWNPSTGVYRKLKWDQNLYDFRRWDQHMHGFGYDESSDDYKIVLEALDRKTSRSSRSKFLLFSLRKNSWKILPDNNPFGKLQQKINHLHLTGCFLNGSLHWGSGKIYEAIILGFSLMTETFYTIAVPMAFRQLQGGTFAFVCLTILGGCLCIFSDCHQGDEKPGVWTMKEYGVQESWVRVIEFDWEELDDEKIAPHCVTKNGAYVVNMRECGLVLLNPKEKIIDQFRDPFNVWEWWYICIPYEETLISPYAWEKEGDPKPIRGAGKLHRTFLSKCKSLFSPQSEHRMRSESPRT